MAEVELRGIRKSFSGTEILHDVNVDIPDGEFVALVGPSGCGKSTLLRLLAGLDHPSGGKILIDGNVVNFLPPKRRDIAMVFQSYALYPHMTVARNMAFSLKLKGMAEDEINTRVSEAARMLDLEPLLGRKPSELSGGQRQRVAMGRAVVREPKVFLFDEPLSNLDAKLRVQMRGEIKELHRKLGTTIVYVTHDQIEALTMADRIVVMNAGRVEQIGAPLDVYDRPETTFVAGFVGSPAMNLLPGKLTAGENGTFTSDKGLSLPVGAVPSAFDGRPVICGFRPEHLVAGGTIDAAVSVSEPTGSETLILAKAKGEQITVFVRDRMDARHGERIGLSVSPEQLHFFAPDNGRRMELTADQETVARIA
ncbi:ABC transporter ATP-binding protein [Oricola indica]|uniref:ABC transporter ATP-binding protein n=1 Tax=Oricola indica TaxID=2872591 RepID=UPI001CC02770|nr:sn-glycerol-3-phosphate ABC transporter ATP-binding protein UgpC [Oricola indica]